MLPAGRGQVRPLEMGSEHASVTLRQLGDVPQRASHALERAARQADHRPGDSVATVHDQGGLESGRSVLEAMTASAVGVQVEKARNQRRAVSVDRDASAVRGTAHGSASSRQDEPAPTSRISPATASTHPSSTTPSASTRRTLYTSSDMV